MDRGVEYVEVVEYYMEYVVCLPPIVQTNKANKPTVVKPSSVKLMGVSVIILISLEQSE